jgi:hypothetical protein
MAILLEFNYGKKLGLPGYSSHNFGVSMKAEVNDPEAIPEEAERVYSILQQSVDSQIANPGFIPSVNGKIEIKEPEVDPDKWNCTERQKGLLLTILDRNGLEPIVVEDLSREIHGRSMADLGKMQVSAVIGEVLDRWGKHPKNANGRTAGGRQ